MTIAKKITHYISQIKQNKQQITQTNSTHESMIQEVICTLKVNFISTFTLINSEPVWNWILWIFNSKIRLFNHRNNKTDKIYNNSHEIMDD